jgi:ornithine carbamoyltransferase
MQGFAPGAASRYGWKAATHRHFLTVSSLDRTEFGQLLDLAARMKRNPMPWLDGLRGGKLGMIFDKPSTRTRVSFEGAGANLGMHPLVLRPDELQIGRGESASDTANVLSRMIDALAWRTFSQTRLEEFASHATIPVINALTDEHHPCQALADYMTLWEESGDLTGRRLAYVGDGNNVAHSLIEAAPLCGVDIVLATPAGYEPNAAIVAAARERGGDVKIEVVHDPREAVAGADAVYTDTWVSMGEESEREARLRAFEGYIVDEALFAAAKPDAIFLHCLPAYRGKEVSVGVIDGPRSRIWDEAENRLWTEMALVYVLVSGDWRGERIA